MENFRVSKKSNIWSRTGAGLFGIGKIGAKTREDPLQTGRGPMGVPHRWGTPATTRDHHPAIRLAGVQRGKRANFFFGAHMRVKLAR